MSAVVRPFLQAGGPDHCTVTDLTHWVANLPGSKRNPSGFGLASLRATPCQVIESGGDCADRALLLCALLQRAGLRATRLMLFDEEDGRPVHTVVEARLPNGDAHLADPTFDLDFPRPDGRSYYGLAELRRDPDILTSRVEQLRASRPWPARIIFYPLKDRTYHGASTFNWRANTLTRCAYAVLHPLWRDRLHGWPRPAIMERPQLTCAAAVLLAGGAAAWFARWFMLRLAPWVREIRVSGWLSRQLRGAGGSMAPAWPRGVRRPAGAGGQRQEAVEV